MLEDLGGKGFIIFKKLHNIVFTSLDVVHHFFIERLDNNWESIVFHSLMSREIIFSQ